MAALIAAAQLPPPTPVATVSYASAGRVLVIGRADRAARAAALLEDRLDVSLLLTTPGGTLPQTRMMAVHTGRPTRIAGWLGAFEVAWTSANPIDADLCTRCNACIEVCPEQAIDFSYQIDLAKCTGHRDCVRACGAAGAIDFERAADRGERALRPRPRPAGRGADRPAPAAAGLLPRRRRRRRSSPSCCACARASASSRSRSSSTTGKSSAPTRATARSAAPRASTSARRRRSAATP